MYDHSAASPRTTLGALPARENFARKRLALMERGGALGQNFQMPPIGAAAPVYDRKMQKLRRDVGGGPFSPIGNPITATRMKQPLRLPTPNGTPPAPDRLAHLARLLMEV